MKKTIFWLMGLLFSASLVVTSCDETDGAVDPYYNWEERNKLYIDSIARVANANLGEEIGQWKVILSYKQTFPNLSGSDKDVNDYVYCKILEKGTGTVKPLFTDTVDVHYRGKLIPLYDGSEVVFDQSYKGELDDDVAVYATFNVNGLIEGWTTILQHMVAGDRWELHIPYQLGYGIYGSGDIPGYSALVFDVQLDDVHTNR